MANVNNLQGNLGEKLPSKLKSSKYQSILTTFLKEKQKMPTSLTLNFIHLFTSFLTFTDQRER